MHHLLNADGAPASKVMTASQAVERYVTTGSVIGMGGQNINRCPMALVHEVVRQGVGDLRVVGCNLSLPVDLLVAEGLVSATEQGSANLERYGVLFCWRRAAEDGRIAVEDYSHLSMATRFLAGAMGVPFMPTRSLVGTSVLAGLTGSGGPARLVDDPWSDHQVVLLQARTPDVSLIHATMADTEGNVVVEGVTSHEVDMVRASAHTVVSAEQVLPAGAFADDPERVTISGAYVSAVVEQPYGAWPTSVYRRYDYDDESIAGYQALARAGDEGPREWVAQHIHQLPHFDAYLETVDPDATRRTAMEAQMRRLT